MNRFGRKKDRDARRHKKEEAKALAAQKKAEKAEAKAQAALAKHVHAHHGHQMAKTHLEQLQRNFAFHQEACGRTQGEERAAHIAAMKQVELALEAAADHDVSSESEEEVVALPDKIKPAPKPQSR